MIPLPTTDSELPGPALLLRDVGERGPQASGAAAEAGDQVMTAADRLEVELSNGSRGWLQRASVN